MADQPKSAETQEQVRSAKVTARFLLCCAHAWKMRCINVRPEYAKIVLTRNGFSDSEAQESVDQCNDRWGKMSDKAQRVARFAVQTRQTIKDLRRR